MKRDNSSTKRFLVEAGVASGMQVIEIGCGGGEVTQLLAEIVGPSGTVVAVDRHEDALRSAQAQLASQGIRHVRFVLGDVSNEDFDPGDSAKGTFDVLAGRRVLMYLENPAAVIRRLSEWLRAGGVAVFEEADSTMIPGRVAPMPAHDQATRLLESMLVAERANPSMGFALPSTFINAGLVLGKVRAEAVIQGQGAQYPLADLVTMMTPRLIASGTANEAELNSLADRLREEASDPARVFVSDVSFCAWAYKR